MTERFRPMTNKRWVVCAYCGDEVENKIAALNKHLTACTEQKPHYREGHHHKCRYCNEVFRGKTLANKHLMKHFDKVFDTTLNDYKYHPVRPVRPAKKPELGANNAIERADADDVWYKDEQRRKARK